MRDFSFSESTFSNFSECESESKTSNNTLLFYNSGVVTYGPVYLNFGSSSIVESVNQILLPKAGTLENLTVKISNPPGTNNSRIIKIRINGIDSNLTLTINNSETFASSNDSLLVNKGDLMSIQADTIGNLDYSIIYVSLEFNEC